MILRGLRNLRVPEYVKRPGRTQYVLDKYWLLPKEAKGDSKASEGE